MLSEHLHAIEEAILQKRETTGNLLNEVHFEASKLFSIDASLKNSIWHGLNILVVAARVHFTNIVVWDVSGYNGFSGVNNGEAGKNAESGGNVAFVCPKYKNRNCLIIHSNGGNGGNGVKGNVGESGKSIEDLEEIQRKRLMKSPVKKKNRLIKIVETIQSLIEPGDKSNKEKVRDGLRGFTYMKWKFTNGMQYEFCYSKGYFRTSAYMLLQGSPGVKGNPGGKAGLGGQSGTIKICDGHGNVISTKVGKCGKNGIHGDNGKFGKSGTDVGYVDKSGMKKVTYSGGIFTLSHYKSLGNVSRKNEVLVWCSHFGRRRLIEKLNTYPETRMRDTKGLQNEDGMQADAIHGIADLDIQNAIQTLQSWNVIASLHISHSLQVQMVASHPQATWRWQSGNKCPIFENTNETIGRALGFRGIIPIPKYLTECLSMEAGGYPELAEKLKLLQSENQKYFEGDENMMRNMIEKLFYIATNHLNDEALAQLAYITIWPKAILRLFLNVTCKLPVPEIASVKMMFYQLSQCIKSAEENDLQDKNIGSLMLILCKESVSEWALEVCKFIADAYLGYSHQDACKKYLSKLPRSFLLPLSTLLKVSSIDFSFQRLWKLNNFFEEFLQMSPQESWDYSHLEGLQYSHHWMSQIKKIQLSAEISGFWKSRSRNSVTKIFYYFSNLFEVNPSQATKLFNLFEKMKAIILAKEGKQSDEVLSGRFAAFLSKFNAENWNLNDSTLQNDLDACTTFESWLTTMKNFENDAETAQADLFDFIENRSEISCEWEITEVKIWFDKFDKQRQNLKQKWAHSKPKSSDKEFQEMMRDWLAMSNLKHPNGDFCSGSTNLEIPPDETDTCKTFHDWVRVVKGYKQKELQENRREVSRKINYKYPSDDWEMKASWISDVIIMFDNVIFYYFHVRLRKEQIVTILCSFIAKITKESPDEFDRIIAQVKTGEGKTFIVLAVAIIRGLMGQKVDVITSSVHLAFRDAREYTMIYEAFGLSVGHVTMGSIEERMNEYEKVVVYGTVADFQRDYLITEFYQLKIRGESRKRLEFVIVDEVDNMLLDKANNTLYLAQTQAGLEMLDDIFLFTWNEVIKELRTRQFQPIEMHAKVVQKMASNKHFPSFLCDFVKLHLCVWITSAYQATKLKENIHYKIRADRQVVGSSRHPRVVIIDQDTGEDLPDYQWDDGLQQFLQLKHGCKLTQLRLKSAFISNVKYFVKYQNMLGLTGTLGVESDKAFLQETYYVCHHWHKKKYFLNMQY